MRSLEYVSSTGATVSFDGPLYAETAPALRGRAWAYTLGASRLTGVAWQARELTLTIKALDAPGELDRLRMLADHDMQAHASDAAMCGLLRVDGEWECRALIAKAEPQSIGPRIVETQLTVVQLSKWRRRLPTMPFLSVTADTDASLDLPTDLPCDLMGMAQASSLDVQGPDPMAWEMVVYGPAVNPHITIAGNTHQIDVTVPSGGYLLIDAVAGERSVTLVAANGDRRNVFASAVRGEGEGSGRYVFQPLPAGVSAVSWPNSFGFDLTPIEERSEPPWT